MRSPDGTFPTAEEHEAAIQQVIAAGKKVRCATGIHAMDTASALQRAEQGMRFIAVGSDLRMMMLEAQRTITQLFPGDAQKDLARY
jgi:4-hydroxy-2-oxoheptanedioate aldolase